MNLKMKYEHYGNSLISPYVSKTNLYPNVNVNNSTKFKNEGFQNKTGSF